MTGPFPTSRRWIVGRNLVVAACGVPVLLIAALQFGAFIKYPAFWSMIGSIYQAFSPLWTIILMAMLMVAWALDRRWRSRATRLLCGMTMLVLCGQIYILAAILLTARNQGLSPSLAAATIPRGVGEATPTMTVTYTRYKSQPMLMDVYLPPETGRAAIPVVHLHGGGYVGGGRGALPYLARWYTARGYAVFDVDYPLARANDATYQSARDTIACALAFVGEHARAFHIDPSRLILSGNSAGGGLALQVGYGLGDGSARSSCGGVPPQPRAIVATYPGEDAIEAWRQASAGRIADTRINMIWYLGGPPDRYAARYREISAIHHVRPGLPPTLLITAAFDHVVPLAGHERLAAALKRAGVPHRLVVIPYSDHGFDIFPTGLAGQLRWRATADFLRNHRL